MAVITISRQFGSGGDEVADRVCEILGYSHFDKRQIDQAAADAGLSGRKVIDYSEDIHEVQSFFNRLFGQSITMAQMMAWMENPAYYPGPDSSEMYQDESIALIRQAIITAGQMGDMVIVGRGGQVLLQKAPDALHVRIEASLEWRIDQILLHQVPRGNPEDPEQRRKAKDLIQKRDIASADYIQQFYKVDWNDLDYYHLVLNMGRLSIEQAAQAVVALERKVHPASV